MSLLEARNLHKHYRQLKAVDGISLEIPPGVCFGLLGPNGAGKTTTVEMLEGILAPTAGEVLFDGCPLGPRFREQAGIMFQQTALPERLTVAEALDLFGGLYPRTRPRAELIERFALGAFLDRETCRLSGGQRQRLLLAIAMINDPLVIFLDEPTTGLDPQARRNFWELAESIKAEGKTLVLTTHYMAEAHALCDEIVIMDHGRIVTQGAPQELLQRHFDTSVISLPERQLPAGFAPAEGEEGYRRNGRLEIHSRAPRQTLAGLLAAEIPLDGLQVRPPTLEDLFIELTGHELRG